MKRIVYPTLLVILISFAACDKSKIVDAQSDSEFIDYISTKDPRGSIIRIDSLAKAGVYSTHKTGLLYYEKGRILGTLEKDVEAIGSLTKALALFEKENNTYYIAKTSMLLSDSNAFLGKNDIAETHINVALQIFKELGDQKGEAKALNSLAHIEFQKEDFKKSIEYVNKAAEIQTEINDFERLSASYNNIGFILEQTNEYEAAKEYYIKAIELNKRVNRLNSNAQRNLGYVHFMHNEYDQCIGFYLEALNIEEQTGVLAIQKDIYDVLLEVSLKTQNFEDSSQYLKKRDSINQLMVSYENEEKIKLVEDQYKLIAKETELKQVQKNNVKNKIIFGILIGSLSFLALFLYQRNKSKQLELSQEKLILEQKMLRTQMNPHFIFNALTAIQKTIFDENPLKAATYISRFAKLIRQNFEFVNRKTITLSEDLEALKNYIKTQQLRFENKFDYKIELSDEIDPTFIKIPPMLLQIFVENSIEHGLKSKKEKGLIQIMISEEKEYTEFKIIDNGVGFKIQEKDKDREHAIDIFKKRLKLRNLGEEKLFSVGSPKNGKGTQITFYLKL